MKPDESVWVFVGRNARFPGGIFRKKTEAVAWIQRHGLTGTLSILPVDTGVFGWAVENYALSLRPETLTEKSRDPSFIASCLPASLDHSHYECGREQ